MKQKQTRANSSHLKRSVKWTRAFLKYLISCSPFSKRIIRIKSKRRRSQTTSERGSEHSSFSFRKDIDLISINQFYKKLSRIIIMAFLTGNPALFYLSVLLLLVKYSIQQGQVNWFAIPTIRAGIAFNI